MHIEGTRRNRIAAGTVMLLAGVAGVWFELGREEVRQGLATFGGPDPQSILLFGLIAAAGVAVILWNLTRPKDDEPSQRRP